MYLLYAGWTGRNNRLVFPNDEHIYSLMAMILKALMQDFMGTADEIAKHKVRSQMSTQLSSSEVTVKKLQMRLQWIRIGGCASIVKVKYVPFEFHVSLLKITPNICDQRSPESPLRKIHILRHATTVSFFG